MKKEIIAIFIIGLILGIGIVFVFRGLPSKQKLSKKLAEIEREKIETEAKVRVANEIKSERNSDLEDIVEVTVEYEKPGYKHSSNEIWVQGETTVGNAKKLGYIGFKNYKNTDKVEIHYPFITNKIIENSNY